ncbi:MAG TPA: hypothetical protein DCM18_08955 [Ruminococcus sp.]|nr:hypothetical protein [Ruminococcus sp.]HCW13645.1 hypothetical protein [Ruminococcus sp.]
MQQFSGTLVNHSTGNNAGAYLHGLAGDVAAARYSEQAMLPQDLLRCLPEVFLKLEQERTAKE